MTRHEFEIANYFKEFTPEIEILMVGLNKDWTEEEWNKFFTSF
jgi:hypothetical protein